MISIQTYVPPKLSPLIKSFWWLKVSGDLKGTYVEEIIPDGHHEIVFHFDAYAQRQRKGQTGWEKDPAIYFTGQNSKSYVHQLKPGAVIYGIRFHPHTQALFYDFPAVLATDKLISFHDIITNDSITSCIADSPEKTFANLEREFLKKAAALQPFDYSFQYVDAVVQQIMRRSGDVKISSLETVTGVSTRYLEKCFQKYVGVTPKQFCSLVRFKAFVTHRQTNPDKTLTACAHDMGFYDQSQLIHLSRLITGSSPKAHFANTNYINEHFLAR